ncbi:MAG: Alginate biosynthesis transcriptional regulatory protein AlgB [Syntrophorhabdus sp. PtaU1.Bin153]|nr:MAG: Alginate biosynthesis transcriptional regulatory protein AlgB [Syntrophorhabdus sp. PtaU1.Bin153]
MLSREEINRIPLFRGISSEDIAHIADHFSLRIFLPGEYIFLRGEPGHSMFVILEGKVTGTLTNAEGSEYTIANAHEGAFFGELGLLAGEPRSADVKAVTAVLAAEIDQDGYEALSRVYPGFEPRLLQFLAKRVVKARVQWQGDRVKSVKGISRSLLPGREPMEEDPFPGITKWTEDLRKTIDEIAATDVNVLIVGEPGTERVLVARLIVSKGKGSTLPFLFLNCSHPPPGGKVVSRVRGENGNPSLIEEAQESSLFGHEAGSTVYAKGWRRGYLDIADTGTLVLDHVDHLTPKVQGKLLQYLQSSTFSRIGSSTQRKSKVRIIATTTEDMEKLVEQGKFNRELLELLRKRVVTLIPLRERKEDIPAIVQYFRTRYKRRHQDHVNGISQKAMEVLARYGWPLNSAELKEVLGQAVAASQGKDIEEEHIFLDIRRSLTPAKINLLRVEKIRRFVRHRMVPGALRFITVPFFILLIAYTLFGPREQNLGNAVAWSLLWPFLLLSIVFSGRGFCAYCPISAVSNGFAYARKKFLPLPGILKKYGIWIGIVAFVSVFWIEHVTQAFSNARVTGRIFLSITGGAIITTLFFGKRIWCLHICPLGRMLGEFAALSLTELRGNSEVCVYQCETHACLKEKACPMGLHPSTERTRHDCILCFACVRKCKQRSVHLDVLLPHQRILSMRSWDISRTTFVTLLAGSILATQTLRWLGDHRVAAILPGLQAYLDARWETVLALSAITIGFTALTFVASRTKKPATWKQNFVYAGYAYMPLAFFGLFGIYFRQFIIQGNEIPRLLAKLPGLRDFVNPLQITPDLIDLHGLLPVVALAGGALSLYLLAKLRTQFPLYPLSYRLHQIIISLTSLAFAFIL